jgi:glycine/D-amino acid oxidase-like deaminating enzyme
MVKLPITELSYWRAGEGSKNYPKLSDDLIVDVAVVGGGITGLTVAYLCKRAGLKVAVLEKDSIGSGTTGNTTGKVTSQHGFTYKSLKEQHGRKTAELYGEANQFALKEIERIIEKEKIECGWRREDNYVFTADDSQIREFRAEAKVAENLGLPASFEVNVSLPFQVSAAVKFANQATFDAQAYVNGLAEVVNGGGSFIFENSHIVRIRDGNPGYIGTKESKIIADSIVVATNVPTLPLMARGTYCALEYPHTSYIVAGRPSKEITGMYISPDGNHYSILPVKRGGKNYILIGGENHIPGMRMSSRARYRKLAKYAEKHFGVSKIEYRWSARDYMAYDNIPLVGKVYPWSKNLYTATAFRKWGLSGSMVAAIILRDTIMGQTNAWAGVYNSIRTKPVTSIPGMVVKTFK